MISSLVNYNLYYNINYTVYIKWIILSSIVKNWASGSSKMPMILSMKKFKMLKINMLNVLKSISVLWWLRFHTRTMEMKKDQKMLHAKSVKEHLNHHSKIQYLIVIFAHTPYVMHAVMKNLKYRWEKKLINQWRNWWVRWTCPCNPFKQSKMKVQKKKKRGFIDQSFRWELSEKSWEIWKFSITKLWRELLSKKELQRMMMLFNRDLGELRLPAVELWTTPGKVR